LHMVAAPAEATTLPSHCVDAITVAQAFHWFDHDKCKLEFARILKPGGKIALLWNNREEGSFALKHLEVMQRHRVGAPPHFKSENETNAFFRTHKTHRFANKQYFDEERLLALTFSRSYTPAPSDPQYFALVQAVKTLFAEHAQGGVAEYVYQTSVVIGEL